jgi:hypothetical protein
MAKRTAISISRFWPSGICVMRLECYGFICTDARSGDSRHRSSRNRQSRHWLSRSTISMCCLSQTQSYCGNSFCWSWTRYALQISLARVLVYVTHHEHWSIQSHRCLEAENSLMHQRWYICLYSLTDQDPIIYFRNPVYMTEKLFHDYLISVFISYIVRLAEHPIFVAQQNVSLMDLLNFVISGVICY